MRVQVLIPSPDLTLGVLSGNMRGIIPRAIEQVGTSKDRLEGQGWKFEMKVSESQGREY